MIEEPPRHMTVWDRNERLRETLEGLGLYVRPVPDVADPLRIDHLIVSVGLPAVKECPEPTAERSIIPPVEGTDGLAGSGGCESIGGDVINFPAKL